MTTVLQWALCHAFILYQAVLGVTLQANWFPPSSTTECRVRNIINHVLNSLYFIDYASSLSASIKPLSAKSFPWISSGLLTKTIFTVSFTVVNRTQSRWRIVLDRSWWWLTPKFVPSPLRHEYRERRLDPSCYQSYNFHEFIHHVKFLCSCSSFDG